MLFEAHHKPLNKKLKITVSQINISPVFPYIVV